MRQILKQKFVFSTSLKNIISKKITEIQDNEQFKPLRFHDKMKKIYLNYKKRQKQYAKNVQHFEHICALGESPIEDVLQHFATTSKIYSEKYLVDTFQYLRKAYRMNEMDNRSLDKSSYKMFEEESFEHLIEELKFSLGEFGSLKTENLIKIVNILREIKYLDLEILQLMIKRIEGILQIGEKDQEKAQWRHFQIQKRHYYSKHQLDLQKTLLENEDFQKSLDYLIKTQKKFFFKPQVKNLDLDDENDEVFQQFLDSIHSLNENLEAFIEGIINVRKQYLKMCEISKSLQVMRNATLNIQLLHMEENLASVGLISIHDIKDPTLIKNKVREQLEVEKIVRQFFKKVHGEFPEQYLNISHPIEKEKENGEYMNLIPLLYSFVKYAEIPSSVYGQQIRSSLINTKLQKILFDKQSYYTHIPTDRVFRKSFALASKVLKKYEPFIQKYIEVCEPQFLLLWYSSLHSLGMTDYSLKKIQLTPNLISSLDKQSFFALLKMVGDEIGQNFQPSQQIMAAIIEKFEQLIEKHDSYLQFLTCSEICLMMNFIYLFQEKQIVLYHELMKRLKALLKDLEDNENLHPKELQEAKRILFFEQKFQSNPETLLQLKNQSFEQGRIAVNPFVKVIRDALLNGNNHNDHFPFIFTGFNKEDKQTAVYIIDSDNCSIDGEKISMQAKAHIKKMEKQFNLEITPLPINSLLQIDYNAQFIRLKNENMVGERIRDILEKNNKKVNHFLKYFLQILTECKEEISKAKIKKIAGRIQEILNSHNNQRASYLSSESTIKKYQTMMGLLYLKKDLQLLTKQQFKTIDQAFFDQERRTLFKTIDNIVLEMSSNVSKNKVKNKIPQSFSLEGKRTTLELIGRNPNHLTRPELQLIDFSYYEDKRFVEYEDWAKIIKETTGYYEIKIAESSKMTQILARSFCPQAKESLNAFPLGYAPEMKTSPYPLNWKNKYRTYVQKSQKEELQRNEKLSEEFKNLSPNPKAELIIDIQNFKHELKMTKSPKEICEYILSFDFIESLLRKKESQEQKNLNYVYRSSEEYFNFLERKGDKMYLESPYVEYIFGKLEQTQTIKQLIEERKIIKAKGITLYKKGEFTKEQYYLAVNEHDKKLVEEVKKLQKKMLAGFGRGQMLQDSLKLVQIKKNIKQLKRIIENKSNYRKDLDEDFVFCDGQYNNALKLKRARAEQNLIKYSLIYKLAKKRTLKQDEKIYIRNWKNSIINNGPQFNPNSGYTQLQMKDLSEEDKEKMSLSSISLTKHKNLPLTDLILQFSHFFDPDIIACVENNFAAEHYSKKYDIPEFLFETSRNKELKYISNKMEEKVFDKNSKLTQKQIDHLLEMFSVFKSESFSGKLKYNEMYKTLKSNIIWMNRTKERIPLISEYLRLKDYEFYNDYNVNDVKQQKKEQVAKVWFQFFEKPKEKTSAEEINTFVNELCKRMFFVKQKLPPFFGQFILQILHHPNTNKVAKQKLIAYLELFKISVEIDSDELIGLIESYRPDQVSMEDIKKVTGKNMPSAISQFMSEL